MDNRNEQERPITQQQRKALRCIVEHNRSTGRPYLAGAFHGGTVTSLRRRGLIQQAGETWLVEPTDAGRKAVAPMLLPIHNTDALIQVRHQATEALQAAEMTLQSIEEAIAAVKY